MIISPASKSKLFCGLQLDLPWKDRPSGSSWRRWWSGRRPPTCQGMSPAPPPTGSGGRGGERGIGSPVEQRIAPPPSPSRASGVRFSLPPPSKFWGRVGEREMVVSNDRCAHVFLREPQKVSRGIIFSLFFGAHWEKHGAPSNYHPFGVPKWCQFITRDAREYVIFFTINLWEFYISVPYICKT